VIRLLAKLIFISVVVYAGVNLWYSRLEERLLDDIASLERGRPAETVATVQKPVPTAKQDYRIIVTRNIFGARLDAGEEKKEEEVKPENLEPTSLKLVLQGTVSGSERDARAIIVDEKEKRQDIYQVGDAIQNAIIKSIERGKVILEVNGKNEVLTIKEREGGGPGPPQGPAQPPARPVTKAPERPAGQNTTIHPQRNIPVARPHRRVSLRQKRAVPHVAPKAEPEEEEGEIAGEAVENEVPPEDTPPPESEEAQEEEHEPAS